MFQLEAMKIFFIFNILYFVQFLHSCTFYLVFFSWLDLQHSPYIVFSPSLMVESGIITHIYLVSYLFLFYPLPLIHTYFFFLHLGGMVDVFINISHNYVPLLALSFSSPFIPFHPFSFYPFLTTPWLHPHVWYKVKVFWVTNPCSILHLNIAPPSSLFLLKYSNHHLTHLIPPHLPPPPYLQPLLPM